MRTLPIRLRVFFDLRAFFWVESLARAVAGLLEPFRNWGFVRCDALSLPTVKIVAIICT